MTETIYDKFPLSPEKVGEFFDTFHEYQQAYVGPIFRAWDRQMARDAEEMPDYLIA